MAALTVFLPGTDYINSSHHLKLRPSQLEHMAMPLEVNYY